MEQMVVNAVKRTELGKKASRNLRKTGFLPAVMYNSKGEAVSLTVNEHEFTKVWKNSTPTTLIDLQVEKKSVGSAFIKATEYNILKDKNLHVDFHVVDADKPLKSRIKLQFSGNPVGVREGGKLVNHVQFIDIQCLPKDLPVRIVTDISTLGIGKTLRIKDIALDKAVKVASDMETPVISISSAS